MQRGVTSVPNPAAGERCGAVATRRGFGAHPFCLGLAREANTSALSAVRETGPGSFAAWCGTVERYGPGVQTSWRSSEPGAPPVRRPAVALDRLAAPTRT